MAERPVLNGVRNFPGPDERKRLGALVVRTDYSDGTTWRALRTALEIGDVPAAGCDSNWPLLFVEGADWAGATVDEVRDVAHADGWLSVVFVADRTALIDPEHKVLAVATRSAREFRVVPGWVMILHGTLALTDVRFDEFATAAARDPGGVFRGFTD
jgi:hypothetical protein